MMSRTPAGGGVWGVEGGLCMAVGVTLRQFCPGRSESGGEPGKLAGLHSALTASGALCEADAARFLFFLCQSC